MVKRVSSYRCHHVMTFLFLFYSYPPFMFTGLFQIVYAWLEEERGLLICFWVYYPTCEVSELFVGLCCRILGLWFLYGYIFQVFRSLIRLWVYKSHMSSLISLWVCVSQDIMSRLIYACTSLFSWILALNNIPISVPSESVSHWVMSDSATPGSSVHGIL